MKFSIIASKIKFYLWVGLAFFLICMFADMSRNSDTFCTRSINNIWLTAYIILAHYYLFEFTIPALSRKSIFRSLLLILFQIFLYSFGLYIWRSIGLFVNIYDPVPELNTPEETVAGQMQFSMQSLLFFGIIKHVYDHIRLKQITQQLMIEKQTAELNYLKSQTNPHFLFNTLNNIYSLSRDKSDLAPESIMRLSKILRFMLYESSGEFISIEQEIKVISDYIELEKLRYDDSLVINFNYDIDDLKQSIPPLLLMPLIENAFKHGASETQDNPFIDIYLSIKNSNLSLVVKNSNEKHNENSTVKENIGLSNLRRQLELLYTDFNMSILNGELLFIASLKINLASHV